MANRNHSTEAEVLQGQFEEFIKTLITFSYPAQKQIEIIGDGCVGDEMAVDFENHYTLIKEHYLKAGFITSYQKEELDKFDKLIDDYTESTDVTFWCDSEQLQLHIGWEHIRKVAKELLITLNKDHLAVSVVHTIELNSTVIIQRTNTELIEKKEK